MQKRREYRTMNKEKGMKGEGMKKRRTLCQLQTLLSDLLF
jgi:hypothetical protein